MPSFHYGLGCTGHGKKRAYGRIAMHIRHLMPMKLCTGLYGDGLEPCAKFHWHRTPYVHGGAPKCPLFTMTSAHVCSHSEKRAFGRTAMHIRHLMPMKLCTGHYGDGLEPRAKFHWHRMPNVHGGAPKCPLFTMCTCALVIVKRGHLGAPPCTFGI